VRTYRTSSAKLKIGFYLSGIVARDWTKHGSFAQPVVQPLEQKLFLLQWTRPGMVVGQGLHGGCVVEPGVFPPLLGASPTPFI
jgi:hypothetical protein